jgi:hypothetical protein
LIISFSVDLELYALSRHRCWFCILVFFFEKEYSKGRLGTELPLTSVTAFMSWVLADDDMIADKGYVFFS